MDTVPILTTCKQLPTVFKLYSTYQVIHHPLVMLLHALKGFSNEYWMYSSSDWSKQDNVLKTFKAVLAQDHHRASLFTSLEAKSNIWLV